MTTDAATRIADDYLARLNRAAERAGLPESRRTELQDQLREHLTEARAAAGSSDPTIAVLDATDRLGDPEDIVAAALEDEPTTIAPATAVTAVIPPAPRDDLTAAPPTARPRFEPPRAAPAAGVSGAATYRAATASARPSNRDITTIAFVAFGWILPLVGWMVSSALVLSSRRWTARERTLGVLGPLAGVLLSAGWLGVSLLTDSDFGLDLAGRLQLVSAVVGLATGAALLRSRSIAAAGHETVSGASPRPTVEGSFADEITGGRAEIVEVVAIVGIGLGWLVGGLGTLIGVVAVILGPRWTTGQKAVAIIVPFAATALGFSVFVTSPDPLSMVLGFGAIGVLASLFSAGFLWSTLPEPPRLSRRP